MPIANGFLQGAVLSAVQSDGLQGVLPADGPARCATPSNRREFTGRLRSRSAMCDDPPRGGTKCAMTQTAGLQVVTWERAGPWKKLDFAGEELILRKKVTVAMSGPAGM